MKNRPRQLFSLTEPSFVAPSYVDDLGKLVTQPANNIPLMTWPDGSWCPPANTFMRELYELRRSRRCRGGTLATTASKISHLLRFCWQRRTDVHALTDNGFREFIGELLAQTKPGSDQLSRNSSTVLSIGRACLQFLYSVSKQTGDPSLIGPEGRVRAELRTFQLRIIDRSSGKPKTVEYWYHPALPEAEAVNKRMPVSTANIEAIRRIIGSNSTSSHQRMRRHVVLKLLEITGARRGEIAEIRVSWVRRAAQMDVPMLRVPTFKKKARSRYRYLPISRADLHFLLQYVDFHRRAVIRKHLKGKADHDFLLVSGSSGQPLQPGSITNEIRDLAIAAGIDEKACPHMFRHRFLTKLFVALIEHHEAANKDEFRKLLLNSEELKQKVAEWSGHSSLTSLDFYIDLAFDEVSSFKKIYNLAIAGIAVDAFLGTIQAEAQALESGESPAAVVERLLKELAAFKLDLAERQEMGESSPETQVTSLP